MRRTIPLLTLILSMAAASAQQRYDGPIIDMHLHALPVDFQGPPPQTICAPFETFPSWDPGRPYVETFGTIGDDEGCANPMASPTTDDALMQETFEVLDVLNIFGVTSGPPAVVDRWRAANPERVIPALMFDLSPDAPTPDTIREWYEDGKIEVLGEVTIQYQGIEPDDERFETYLATAEEIGLPVGIHIGTGPPGAPYLAFPNYRARMHNPLSLEEPLRRHPKLRVYVMHAGWPMLDHTLAMLYVHPQVYVEVGVISYILPRAEFHRYLRRLVEAGFGNRVMFGSDHMIWPGAIEHAVESIQSADFLTAEQKKDIFYDNAARFLRLSEEEIAAHHGRRHGSASNRSPFGKRSYGTE